MLTLHKISQLEARNEKKPMKLMQTTIKVNNQKCGQLIFTILPHQ